MPGREADLRFHTAHGALVEAFPAATAPRAVELPTVAQLLRSASPPSAPAHPVDERPAT